MKIKNVKIGADPELFFEERGTGKILTVEGIIHGTKESPTPIDDKGHFVQRDNILAEFNIPPAESLTDFKTSIRFVLGYLSMIAELNNCVLNFNSANLIDGDQLVSETAREFGCDPDYNVYTGKPNVSPDPDMVNNLRCAGGHIHIGYDNPTVLTSQELVKLCDIFLTLPTLKFDKDMRRRTMYGKAGSYRLKKYGVEYRTLSNFWLKNVIMQNTLYTTIIRMILYYNETPDNERKEFIDKWAPIAREIINKGEVERSKKVTLELYQELSEDYIKRVIKEKTKTAVCVE